MRDPDGRTVVEQRLVRRVTERVIGPDHFLRSTLAARWIERGRITPFRVEGPNLVTAERIPVVSYPHEWCDRQLHDAARLTLELQREANDAGFDLKDASAWNLVFADGRPVFCDLLSPVALTDRVWWAAGQFARHFLLPLLVARRGKLPSHMSFALWRDGIPPIDARRLLGPTGWLSRCLPLLLDAGGGRSPREPSTLAVNPTGLPEHRRRLLAGLEWMLAGVAPSRGRDTESTWSGYVDARSHYSGESLVHKRETIQAWLHALEPAWVLDLGCNSGEFSELAEGSGAHVVAVDADHGAIDRLYRRLTARGTGTRILPVIGTLDDIGAGRGWAGAEFPGLIERLRGRCDLVMMLALLHHLAVAAAVPLEHIAAFVTDLGARRLIVEWIDHDDPQMQLLCRQRRRDPAAFSAERQRAAFAAAGWRPAHELHLPGTRRSLALLERA